VSVKKMLKSIKCMYLIDIYSITSIKYRFQNNFIAFHPVNQGDSRLISQL
jgi:hypothetical protein